MVGCLHKKPMVDLWQLHGSEVAGTLQVLCFEHVHCDREIYTKSDAWKRAIPGFITALERLPGCSVQPREDGLSSQNRKYSSGLADDDFEGTVRECAACTRKHTRAAMQLVLKGKLGDPGYIRGAK